MRATSLAAFLYPFAFIGSSLAASADQWRGRSIYQIITDRYALPAGADTNACNTTDQTWCGGTWNTIRENLDYVQNMGFTAIWISPTSQNYDGPRTTYGDAYHGYWIADASQLNDRFGTSDDLKALSAELHSRGMYLMVDIVANNVMATSTTPDYSQFMFKDEAQYHSYCPIDWNNETSIENCWLGDTNVPLPDVNTQDPDVVSGYASWIQSFVQEYEVDGLRIDAAKHVHYDFWTSFCGSAGVFCMGEVFGDDIGLAATYQSSMDSVLNYPMYDALVEGFAIPGPGNMTAVTETLVALQGQMKDATVLGNFLENQDVERWASMSSDPVSLHNAMVFNFMSDGIPIMYYGQEQGLTGSGDPYNRGPLWTSGYAMTETYNLTATVNMIRNYLTNQTDWAKTPAQVLTTEPDGIAIMKGEVLSILTNIGSPPQNDSVKAYTSWEESFSTTDVLSCTQYAVGSNGTVQVNYNKGGKPVILVPDEIVNKAGMCGSLIASTRTGSSEAGTSGAGRRVSLAGVGWGGWGVVVGLGMMGVVSGLL
ncbi:glycoside hydrolase family 13 protein [Stereum hirsutum FP-91666 SS1]|uniref:glycoside hydrolase family 13 protein n=1 Tax=Stereum hirsutum (strain FP-91666) TaxID=721885 RepID=UPI0004449F0B|nr:glycoside hydrolase family 13 protein [Stereum hirsutum FP-91666 SS1]EIM82537.1 glycoside hydrolase family 13 protein [Stereum hirsutum FP-91666 SS1]